MNESQVVDVVVARKLLLSLLSQCNRKSRHKKSADGRTRREGERARRRNKNVNRFPKPRAVCFGFGVFFFCARGAIRLRGSFDQNASSATRQHQRPKSRHNQFSYYYFFCVKCVIIIFVLLSLSLSLSARLIFLLFSSSPPSLAPARCCDDVEKLLKEEIEKKSARDVNFL